MKSYNQTIDVCQWCCFVPGEIEDQHDGSCVRCVECEARGPVAPNDILAVQEWNQLMRRARDGREVKALQEELCFYRGYEKAIKDSGGAQ